jgi:ribosomal protein S18 acetylase RimI-like enzyme
VPGPFPLSFRTIDPLPDGADARLAYENHCEACRASFGPNANPTPFEDYRRWLARRVEEFPQGHVMAYLGWQFIGQLELEIPYGKTVGYVDLFYVAKPFRRQGYGRLLHDYAGRYFRSWDAQRIALDVSPDNRRAVGFYRRLGYRFVHIDGELARVWRMEKRLSVSAATS